MPEIHAKLSASGSAKWLNCPASINMEAEFPNTTSEAAEEGTKAHALAELKLKMKFKEISRYMYGKGIGALGSIEPDMDNYTDNYVDYVIARYNDIAKTRNEVQITFEQRLDFSEWVPEGFGTGDTVIIADNYIEIIDLKYGKGILVLAENNTQLGLYALGAYEEFNLIYNLEPSTEVVCTIYQPRKDNISTMETSLANLLKWAKDTVVDAAKEALTDTASCKCGVWCDSHFCRARPICKAYADSCLEMTKFDFAMPGKLNEEDIANILEKSQRLSEWSKLVKDYALQKAQEGVEYPGWKLVEGKSKRNIIDEAEAANRLIAKCDFTRADITNTKLKGLLELEKLCGGTDRFEEILGGLIVKPQGAPTLVPISDKRPAIGSAESAKNVFKDEIEK